MRNEPIQISSAMMVVFFLVFMKYGLKLLKFISIVLYEKVLLLSISKLFRLAIGAHGQNIQQARKVEGILNVEIIEDSCTFKVIILINSLSYS